MSQLFLNYIIEKMPHIMEGPISSIPEINIPKFMINDEEFEQIYSNKDAVTYPHQCLARDYAVDQFLRGANLAALEDKSVVDVLSEFSKEELTSLFWGADLCRCCARHRNNSPVSIETNEESNLSNLLISTENSNCFCHCRAAKRFFRQAYRNKNKN